MYNIESYSIILKISQLETSSTQLLTPSFVSTLLRATCMFCLCVYRAREATLKVGGGGGGGLNSDSK